MPVNNHLLSVRLGYIRFHVFSFCYFLINNRLFRAYILNFFLLHLCHLSPPPSWFPIKFYPTFLRLNCSFRNSSIANVWFLRSCSHLRMSPNICRLIETHGINHGLQREVLFEDCLVFCLFVCFLFCHFWIFIQYQRTRQRRPGTPIWLM